MTMDTRATEQAPPRLHKLKCEAQHFAAILNGTKTSEARLNDRNYIAADFILLEEIRNNDGGRIPDIEPTGREVLVRITHVLPGGKYGIDSQYAILSIQLTAEVPTR